LADGPRRFDIHDYAVLHINQIIVRIGKERWSAHRSRPLGSGIDAHGFLPTRLMVSSKMPEQSIIVWDLETVPDLEAAARMLDMGEATEADVRQALGSGFPKHPLHKIVCIGALIASRQTAQQL
jgi:hypothetical protein